jgi:hypothetical protein
MANSRKTGGRCVAGLRMDEGSWIRPVSECSDGTLVRRHYVLDDGNEASLLDIIEVEVTEHRPKPYQPENWILKEQPWELINRIPPREAYLVLQSHVELGSTIFGNQGDRVPYAGLQTCPIAGSLTLVEPTEISWFIGQSIRGKRQTRTHFKLGDVWFDIAVTDPVWEKSLSNLDFGIYPKEAAGISINDRVLFTVSLGGPFNGECYKLIAGVFVLPTAI